LNNNQNINNSDFLPSDQYEGDPIDVRELLFAFLRNWYWILLFVVLGFFGARLYLRYTVPIYQANGKILIKEEESSGLSEEAVLQEIGILKPSSNIENEIQILKSRTLMQEVMEDLGLNVEYLGLGRLRNTDLYQHSPVVVDSVCWGEGSAQATLDIEVNGLNSFTLLDLENEIESTHAFSDPLILDRDTFWLRYIPDRSNANRIQINIGVGPNRYLQPLQIKTVDDYSSVLNLQIEDPVPQKPLIS
jgi:hypothetical protein